MKKTSFFFGIIFSIVGIASQAKDFTLLSPDKHLKVTVTDGNDLLTYSVYHNDSLILKSNQIGLVTLDKQLTAGTAVKVASKKSRTIVQDIISPFYRFKSFRAACNEMNLKLKGDFGVIFRAYNEGVAYRSSGNRRLRKCKGDVAGIGLGSLSGYVRRTYRNKWTERSICPLS